MENEKKLAVFFLLIEKKMKIVAKKFINPNKKKRMEKEIYLLISNSKSKWDCIRNEHCRSINDNHCRTGCNFISMTIIRFWIIEDIREKNESDWDWLLNKNSLRMRIAKKEQETNLFEYVENHSINHFQTMNLVWFFFIVLDWFFRCIALSVSLNYFILYCLLLVFFFKRKISKRIEE